MERNRASEGVHPRSHSEDHPYFEVFTRDGVIYWANCNSEGTEHYSFREGPFETLEDAYNDAMRRD